MQEELKIAYYQQDIAWENPEENYRKVERAFADLEKTVDLLVVPETFQTGFSDTMARFAEPQKGPTLAFARRMAQRHDALFVGTWVVAEEGSVFNRLHLVYPDGHYATYDKGHTFRMSTEASQLARGTRRVTVEWRGWRIKPAVCYDLRFPKWLRNAVRNGEDALLDYDLLIVCANWPGSRHEAWSTLLKARAIENLCYVVGVNRTGTDGTGIPYSGDCATIDYKGHVVSACEHNREQVATATLEREALERFRQHWPFYLDFD